MKKPFFIFFLLLYSFSSFAQWTEWKTPYHFTDLVWVDSMTAFGTEGKMTLYKTTDHGKSWKKIEIAPAMLYQAMSFCSPAMGYATCTSLDWKDSAIYGLYKTTDSGNTWRRLNRATATDIHFFTPKQGFCIADAMTIFYTSDSGKTWNSSLRDAWIADYNISPDGVLRVLSGLEYDDGSSLPARYELLDYSLDSGRHWEYSPQTMLRDSHNLLLSLSFPTSLNGFVGAQSFRGQLFMIRTRDGGQHWQYLPSQNVPASLQRLLFTDTSSGYLLAHNDTSGFIYHTTDGGLHWQLQDWRLNNSYSKIYQAPDHHFYVIGNGSILYDSASVNQAIEEKPVLSLPLKAWPNPFHDQVQLRWSPQPGEPLHLLLYDMEGRTVKDILLPGTGQYSLHRDQLPPGIYIARLLSSSRSPDSLKLIIQ